MSNTTHVKRAGMFRMSGTFHNVWNDSLLPAPKFCDNFLFNQRRKFRQDDISVIYKIQLSENQTLS